MKSGGWSRWLTLLESNKAILLLGLKDTNHVTAQRDIFFQISIQSFCSHQWVIYNYIEASVICKKTYVAANISYYVIYVN